LLQIIHTYLGEPNHIIKRRSIDQKLRIYVYYDPDSIPKRSVAELNVIKVSVTVITVFK